MNAPNLHRWRKRAAWLALAVALAAGTVMPGVSLSAKPITNSSYEGKFVGDPSARVSFRVKVRKDGPDRVLFRASNVPLHCDDGTSFRETFREIRLTLRGRVFQGRRFELGQSTQTVYEVYGTLHRDGTADGYVFWIQDFDHPEELGTSDCSTPSPPPWTAQRAR